MSDIVERLKKAARDFEGIRDHEGNMEDSDCEPHWSNYREMDDAGQSAIEGAAEITRLRSELSKVRRETIEACAKVADDEAAIWAQPIWENVEYAAGRRGRAEAIAAAIRAIGRKALEESET